LIISFLKQVFITIININISYFITLPHHPSLSYLQWLSPHFPWMINLFLLLVLHTRLIKNKTLLFIVFL
jgi:hypothetical protein